MARQARVREVRLARPVGAIEPRRRVANLADARSRSRRTREAAVGPTVEVVEPDGNLRAGGRRQDIEHEIGVPRAMRVVTLGAWQPRRAVRCVCRPVGVAGLAGFDRPMAAPGRRRNLGVTTAAVEARAVSARFHEACRLVGMTDAAVGLRRDRFEVLGMEVAERAGLREVRLPLTVVSVEVGLAVANLAEPTSRVGGIGEPARCRPLFVREGDREDALVADEVAVHEVQVRGSVDVVACKAVASGTHASGLLLPRWMPARLGVAIEAVRLRAMTPADAVRPSIRVAAKAVDEGTVAAGRCDGGELVGMAPDALVHRVDGLRGRTRRYDRRQQKDRSGRCPTRGHPSPRANS